MVIHIYRLRSAQARDWWEIDGSRKGITGQQHARRAADFHNEIVTNDSSRLFLFAPAPGLEPGTTRLLA
jgi:hypothetical protein